MNNQPVHIDQRSLDRLGMNMEQFQREFFTEAKEGLKNLGQRIVANAQENLKKKKLVGLSAGSVRRGNTIASGDLINSGRTAESDDNQILAGFPMNYAYYVEYGRRAGGYPPFAAIYQWIKDKKLSYADEKDLEQMTFAIRAKIGEKGTKPSPFLRPAYEKNKKSVDNFVAKAVKKVLTKDYTR